MYYNKKQPRQNSKSYTYSLADFSKGVNRDVDENALSMDYAYMAYNVKYKDKALKQGHGIKDLTTPSLKSGETLTFQAPISDAKPLRIWNTHITAETTGTERDILLVYCDNGYIYKSFMPTYAPVFTKIFTEPFTSIPTVINYKYNGKYVSVICSPTDDMYLWNLDTTPVKSTKNLHLTSLCSHYERLFATTSTNKHQVRFSKDFDITNWNETSDAGGFIELVDDRGNINKVLSLNDYVYLIRDLGISRLSAYGDQSEFSVTHICHTSNLIYANTATVCGDRIVYLATDGLYYCVGSSVYKYNIKINDLFDKTALNTACACYYDGKYYLSARMNFDDGKNISCESETDYKNNVLIEFDLQTQKLNITRGIDICAMTSFVFDGWQRLAVLFNGANNQKIGQLTDDGKIFDSATKKCWQSPATDLSTLAQKSVRSISLISPTNVDITIKTERESQTLHVLGSDKLQKLVCNVKGVKISVAIESNSQTLHISNLSLDIDVLEE